jgi:predicted CoA-binding protein
MIPASIADFLTARRVAVAGVSRGANQPANLIFRRLRDTGHEVVPVNPAATEVEGQRCYADLASIPGNVDAVMVVTHPGVSPEIVRQAADRGITKLWFHRAAGDGSVSQAALDECEARGITPIVGGCPMMYCGNVDFGHRCFRWWLGFQHRLPV